MRLYWFIIAGVMMAMGLLHVAGVFYSRSTSITSTIWMVGAILLLGLKSNQGGKGE